MGTECPARFGTRQGSGSYVGLAMRKFEEDPEIVGAAVAALSRLYDGQLDMVADFPSIDRRSAFWRRCRRPIPIRST